VLALHLLLRRSLPPPPGRRHGAPLLCSRPLRSPPPPTARRAPLLCLPPAALPLATSCSAPPPSAHRATSCIRWRRGARGRRRSVAPWLTGEGAGGARRRHDGSPLVVTLPAMGKRRSLSSCLRPASVDGAGKKTSAGRPRTAPGGKGKGMGKGGGASRQCRALSPVCERWATWVRVERLGCRGEGGGRTAERRFSIQQHPPHAAALSFADAISAATSTEGASEPVGVVFAAAPRRAPPR
jgi:hypothetical protein